MKIFRSLSMMLALGFSLALSGTVYADATHGTQAEAQAMAEKAAAEIKQDGLDKAIAKFNAKEPPFFDRDLYVFVVDDKGNYIAHGTKPALVGKNGMNMLDPNGTKFVEEFTKVKDAAWVDYMWPDPTDGNKVKAKSSYIIHTNNVFVGVGYYKS